MPDYTFTIKTPAELSGVEQAIARFEKLRGQAQASGKDFAELDQKIARAKASIEAYRAAQSALPGELESTAKETKDLSKETEAAGEKMKLFAGQGENVKKVLGQISAESPLLGTAMRALISPIGAAITAAGALFHAIKQDIAETNAKLDEMAALAATPLSNFTEAFKRAQNEARNSNTEFLKGLAALSEHAHKISGAAAAAVEDIQRLASAQLELNNAAQAKAIAQVNQREQLKQISPVQAIEQRQQINEFYAEQTRQTQTAAENETVRVREAEIARLQQQLAEVKKFTGPATADVKRQARITDFAEQGKAAEKAAADYQAKIPAAQEALDKAFEKLVEYRRDLKLTTGKDTGGTYEWKYVEAVDKAESQLRELESMVRLNRKIADRAPANAGALAAQVERESSANEEARALQKQLDDKTRELEELKRSNALNQSVREQTGGLQRDTRKIETDIEIDRARDKEKDLPPTPQPLPPSPRPRFSQADTFDAAAKIENGFADASAGIRTLAETVLVGLGNLNRDLADTNSRLKESQNT